MVKILKRGIPPREDVFKATCSICKTEFTFRRSEARIHMVTNDPGPCMIITCPLDGCTNNVWVSFLAKISD